MKLNRAVMVLVATACVVLAALTVFAIELNSNQTKSRHDIEAQIHDRAVLAGALIDSLFATASQPPTERIYYQQVVTDQDLQAASSSGDVYDALLSQDGSVIAHTSGISATAAAQLGASGAVAKVQQGRAFGLGDFQAHGLTGVVDMATSVPTTGYGRRILVRGVPDGPAPSQLAGFLRNDLQTIPGVAGEVNYVLDGNGTVLASTSSRYPFHTRISQPGALAALQGGSSDRNGTYFAHITLDNSRWRLVLAAPNGPLFATVSGARMLVPWMVLAAFAMVAVVAILLGWRVLRTAGELQEANGQLAQANRDLIGANAALEQRAAELARSNEELDQFASIASHDLQEPLRKVRTFTEQVTVMEGDRLSDKGRDYLTRANGAAERMQKLIEDLLTFSRVSTQGRPFVAVDLGETVQAVLDDLESQIAETGAVVRVHEMPIVVADPLQMRQLLQNLVSNALKFRREGVVAEIDIDASVGNGAANIRVSDNGIGFEPRYAQRIFRIFERLHGRTEYPGTGIGLALCRKIVDRHGGTIAADGEPGRGAVFSVTLPMPYPIDHQPGHQDGVPVAERTPADA